MQRVTSLLVSAAVVSSLVACGVDREDAAGSSTADLTASVPTLNCVSGASTFDVAPTAAGPSEGKLTIGGTTKLFTCAAPAEASTGPLTISCTERTEAGSPATYRVIVVKEGTAFTATAQAYGVAPLTFSCTEPPPPAATASYSDVETIIAQKCSGCHRMAFTTLQKVRTNREAMLSKVASGAMPRGQPTWFETADGKMLVDFLRNSPELD